MLNAHIARMRQISLHSPLSFMLISLLGSLILTLSAKISIPFWPVPMTMQSLTVVMMGALMGPRLAGASVALYLFEGMVGLPVFQSADVMPFFAKPTAGYLMGFLPLAMLMGYLAERGWARTHVSAFFMVLLGFVFLDVFGVSWLVMMLGQKTAFSGWLAYQPGAWVKLGLGTILLPSMLRTK
ncbi:MAG: biotin transporter BioY [Holosporales bacterium]